MAQTWAAIFAAASAAEFAALVLKAASQGTALQLTEGDVAVVVAIQAAQGSCGLIQLAFAQAPVLIAVEDCE